MLFRRRRSEQSTQAAELPIPPLDMRKLVGPTEPSAFDNPTRAPVYPQLGPEAYEAVFDFGCGCGRIARQLIQQEPLPDRYLGIDLHRGMVEWCRANLESAAPGFRFEHHDVLSVSFNPGEGKPMTARFPAEENEFTLVIAHSVFTHLVESQVEHYLCEVARILRRDGVLVSTWFFFEKNDFPMMQEWTNALYINLVDPSAAVIFDKTWVRETARKAGLTLVAADAPEIRGFQWTCTFAPAEAGREEVELPKDTAPVGLMRAPTAPADAHKVGL